MDRLKFRKSLLNRACLRNEPIGFDSDFSPKGGINQSTNKL
jgi:hypothetical protein